MTNQMSHAIIDSVRFAVMGVLAVVKGLAPYSAERNNDKYLDSVCRLAFCTLSEEFLLGITLLLKMLLFKVL